MKNILFTVLFLLLLFTNLEGYETENKLSAVVVGKVANFITWEDTKNDDFIITILDNSYDKLFTELFDLIYKDKKIKDKNIKIKYIDDIQELDQTNILYISAINENQLRDILEYTKHKNILTVSNIRGFAEKGGMVQIYFASQKVKLKVNLDVLRTEHLNIKSSLLRIVDVVQETK